MYKVFVKRAIISIVVMLSLYSLIVLKFKMLYMDPEYPMWLEVKHRIYNNSSITMDIVVVGDSRAKAGFKPTLLIGVNSVNLAVGGATPIEGYFTIKHYLENNPKPDNIILSYTPTHLESDNCWFSRTVPFNFLNKKEYEEVENFGYKFHETYISESNKNYKDYEYPFIYGNRFKEGLIHLRWIKNKTFYSDSKKLMGYHWFGKEKVAHGLNAEAKRQTHFIYSKLHNFYLEKMLKLLNNNKINIYYYTMPFNKSSFDIVKKQEYINGYTAYVDQLAQKYNMVICNIPFYMTDDNFGDPSHLFKGVNENTYKLYNCIKDNK
jgi:hypothetical protein